MIERRTAIRQRVFKGGTISYERAAAIRCVVRNFSHEGACVEVEGSEGIPEHFTLVIKPGYLRRACRVVWRDGHRMGVQFE